MLMLISPAKKLAESTPAFDGENSALLFKENTLELMKILREKSISEIGQLMKISPKLSALNYQRYQSFNLDIGDLPTALFLFQGDVYQGLDATSLSMEGLDYAQSHLMILSGLYGLLRPFDAMYPYRLEMGTRLANEHGTNLYHFWGESLINTINNVLDGHKEQVLINLASTEYFKAVPMNASRYPYITIHFKEIKNGTPKVVGIHAKKARGLMARFVIENQLETVEALYAFNDAGYCYAAELSDQHNITFVR